MLKLETPHCSLLTLVAGGPVLLQVGLVRVLVHPVPGVRDHEDHRAVRPRGLGVTLGVAVHTHHPLAPVSGEYH